MGAAQPRFAIGQAIEILGCRSRKLYYSNPVPLRFAYDPAKDVGNRQRHGMSLIEGVHVLLGDPNRHLTRLDRRQVEERWITIGPHPVIPGLLVVVYHYRSVDLVRLISVRKATAQERKSYAHRIP